MFKSIKKESIYELNENEFIKVNGDYVLILELIAVGNSVVVTLPYDVELVLFQDNLTDYEFVELEDFREDVATTLVHSCRHCARPVSWDTARGIIDHTERCLFNEKNSMCAMCKHLVIYEEAPYPRNHKMYQSPDAEWAFGNYRKPYCSRYEKYLDEEALINRHTECFEIGEGLPKIKHTKDYETWVKASTELEEENTE